MAVIKRVDSRRLDYPIMVENMTVWATKYDVFVPANVKITYPDRPFSSGSTWGSGRWAWEVALHLGTDRAIAEYVVLHEFAHCMEGSHMHDENFYVNLFRLVKKFEGGRLLALTLKNEQRYKSRNSTKVARRMRLLPKREA